MRWDAVQGANAYEIWRGTSDREEEAEKVAETSEAAWDDLKAAQEVIFCLLGEGTQCRGDERGESQRERAAAAERLKPGWLNCRARLTT